MLGESICLRHQNHLQYTGGIHEYSGDTVSTSGGGGVFSTLGLTMMSVGDSMSTLGGVQYTGDIMSILGVFSTPGDYHEYTGEYQNEYWGLSWYTGWIP